MYVFRYGPTPVREKNNIGTELIQMLLPEIVLLRNLNDFGPFLQPVIKLKPVL